MCKNFYNDKGARMQKKLAFYVIISLLACGFFLTLLPYPTFYVGHYNLSNNDIARIHNKKEEENYEILENADSIAFCKLDWNDCVTALMPYDKPLNIIDVKSGTQFQICRVGGSLHADIIPASEEDSTKIDNIFGVDQENEKRAMIIEIQPNIWSASSMCGKAHIHQDNSSSHYCLHFVGSKAHTTKLSDVSHQKAIAYAFKHGKKYL